MKVKNLFSGMLAVLAVLLLTGCWEKDNPVRTSLDVDTSPTPAANPLWQRWISLVR